MNKKIIIRIILIISNILVFMSMTQTHKIKAAIKRHRFSQYVHFPSNIILMACIKFQGYFHIELLHRLFIAFSYFYYFPLRVHTI